ncbi:Metalloenzyme, LuxS/M16 peptidase-like protein [Chytriomyces sp. MP71]|nr:Metalloenzyme, LuxS/M16 peptidase-like protein [Chytriomyces sp. MP71]
MLSSSACSRRAFRSAAIARLASASSPSSDPIPSVGSLLHGFRVLKTKHVPDFDLTAVQLKHEETGADYLHIAKNDSNNVFTVGFQTTPMDSTGVPHILEHTTLCGSKKYPVRDPFFKMLNRSMSTFMNALTGSDITMYPFSTENPKDFDNLFSVYMDAVFHPLLRQLDFKQEGWRLEHEDPMDTSSPIVFKGVVYNEMKGVFSDVNNIYLTRLQQQMYPGTTYGYVSGGDPVNITDLTYEQLVEFHRKHYHPSNAKFVTYGNFPLAPRLAAVDAIISPLGRIKTEPIKNVEPFTTPRRMHITCPPDAMGDPEKQGKLSVSFLTNDGTDAFETFAVRMLATLLTDGPSSPMYRALIESNIGSDYVASTGYDRTARVTNFSVGLQGLAERDFGSVEEKIREVFEGCAKSGFEAGRVESAIHQLELGIRHRRGNFGMGLAQNVVQQWIHGGEPVDALEVTTFINRLREELKTPNFFESRIEKYFLNNPHQLTFMMTPSTTFTEEVAAEEKSRLEAKIGHLSPEELKEIAKDGVQLKKNQEFKDDLSCLPTLTLADVSVKGKTYPVEKVNSNVFPVMHRKTSTNGISYISIARSMEGMKRELMQFLPLYSGALTALGTQKTPSVPDLDDKIRLYTSGISGNASIQTPPSDTNLAISNIQFGTSYLDKNRANAFDLLSEVIQGPVPTFNDELRERLRTVVAGAAASGMNSLADSGHRYAMGLAAGRLTRTASVRQILGGLDSVVFTNQLHEMGDAGVERVFSNIKSISEYVQNELTPSKAIIVSGAEPVAANTESLLSIAGRFGWKDAQSVVEADVGNFKAAFKNTFVPLPFTVNYTARAFLGVPYTHEDSASLQILAELMTSHFLHREVREKGGAYGGFGNYNALDGVFGMASYRDPPGAGKRTIDAYDRAVAWAAEVTKHLGQRELSEAKLSILSSQDAPISASQEGMTLFATGLTDEARQERRERILNASLEAVERAAQTHLAGKQFAQAVLGPAAEGLEKEGWNIRNMQ